MFPFSFNDVAVFDVTCFFPPEYRLNPLRNNIVFYITQPFTKKIICSDFVKRNSAGWIDPVTTQTLSRMGW